MGSHDIHMVGGHQANIYRQRKSASETASHLVVIISGLKTGLESNYKIEQKAFCSEMTRFLWALGQWAVAPSFCFSLALSQPQTVDLPYKFFLPVSRLETTKRVCFVVLRLQSENKTCCAR